MCDDGISEHQQQNLNIYSTFFIAEEHQNTIRKQILL